MSMWKPQVVVYHHPCPDGFTALWVVETAMTITGDDFVKVPANYGQPFDFEACRNKRVLFVDFTLPKADLEKLVEVYGAQIVVLDHHESAQKALAEYIVPLDVRPETVVMENHARSLDTIEAYTDRRSVMPIAAWFDMERSGATLTWDWVHPNFQRPKLLNFIEARDIFKPERAGSPYLASMVMPVSAYLRTYEKTYENWNKLEGHFEYNLDWVLERAEIVWEYHQALVKTAADRAEWEEIAGYKVPVTNVLYDLGTDAAHELLQRYPDAPFAAYYYVASDKATGKPTKFYGLRSESHRVNVSEVAVSLGGGGHRNASGFRQVIG